MFGNVRLINETEEIQIGQGPKGPASQPRKWFRLVVVCLGLLSMIIIFTLIGLLLNRPSSDLETKILQLTEEKERLEQALQNIEYHTSDGWVYFGESWYLSSTTAQNWTESRKWCQERGADLIIINSAEEQEVASLVFKETVWIGLSDGEREGHWRWVDGSVLTTSFWAPREPNDINGGEDCVILSTRRSNFKNWNDIVCTDRKKGICEKPN